MGIVKWKFRKPDAVFMDWDNTIVSTNVVCEETFNAVLRDNGIDSIATQEDVITMNNIPFNTIFDNFFNKTLSQKDRENYIHQYKKKYANYVHLLQLIPGIEELLFFLKKENIVTALLSNKPDDKIQEEVIRFDLGKCFNYVRGITDDIQEKPHPELFLNACANLNIDPKEKEIWFMGDAHSDIRFAENCGMRSIFIGPREDNFTERYKTQIQTRSLVYFNQDYHKMTKLLMSLFRRFRCSNFSE